MLYQLYIPSSPATVSIGYEQAAYSVREGDNVTVCASVMSGVLSRSTSITSSVVPGTALGLGTGKSRSLHEMVFSDHCMRWCPVENLDKAEMIFLSRFVISFVTAMCNTLEPVCYLYAWKKVSNNKG